MKRFWIFLLGAFAGAAVSAGGVLAIRQARRPPEALGVMDINGEVVPINALLDRLKTVDSPGVLYQLMEEKLIEQEAKKSKKKLTPQQERQLEKVANAAKDPVTRAEWLKEGRARLLMDMILSDGITEQDRRRVYADYSEELKQYQIRMILLPTRFDATAVLRALEQGTDFGALAREYSLDEASASSEGLVGFLTRFDMIQLLGPAVSEEVTRLKPQQVSRPVYSRRGLVLVKLEKVLESYEDLKPAVNRVLMQARSLATMHRIYSAARISSPYFVKPVTPLETGNTPAPDLLGTPQPPN